MSKIRNNFIKQHQRGPGTIFRGDKVESHRKLVTRCIKEWKLFRSNPCLLKNSININCLRQTE